MRFGIWPSLARSRDEIHEITAYCERTGWDGVYFAGHFMPNGPGAAPVDGGMLECWPVIAVLAALVPRMRTGSLVTRVTCRHPAVLAKIAVAAGQVSGGRLTPGTGAGWQENEHAAYGIALGTVRERMDRFEEAVQVLRSLPGQDRATFRGRYFQLEVRRASRPRFRAGCRCWPAAAAASSARCGSRPGTPITGIPGLRRKCSRTRSRCCTGTAGDPAGIHVSAQALLYLSAGEEWLREKRQAGPGRPVIAGTPGRGNRHHRPVPGRRR